MSGLHLPTPEEIEAEAHARGLTVGKLCRRADVDPSIYYRWKSRRVVPNGRALQKLIDTINSIPKTEDGSSGG